MLRKMFSFGAVLLLAGAAVLMTTGTAQAQRGGHGGGGNGGGFHAGGYSGGFHAGGYNGGHISGYHGGYGHSWGYRPYYGYHHYWRGYYPYSGYYPYYSFYNYYPYLSGGGDAGESVYSDDTPLLNDRLTGDSGYQGLSAEEYEAYARAATVNRPSPPPVDTLAHVTIRVPTDAEIWIEGTKTTSTGPIREFVSPPLTSGSRYTYDIKASWNENGHAVTQTQHVGVSAGAHVNVDFPVPPKSAAQALAVPQN